MENNEAKLLSNKIIQRNTYYQMIQYGYASKSIYKKKMVLDNEIKKHCKNLKLTYGK